MIKSLAPCTGKSSARSLYSELSRIRAEVAKEGETLFRKWRPSIRRAGFLASAENLAHFIALRRMDLREVQAQLMLLGLSSLGHSESRVLSNIDAILATLSYSVKGSVPPGRPTATEFTRGWNRLGREAGSVLGPQRANRRVRIMATMPVEAAEDADLLVALMREGMELARINCAHGDRDEWKAMIKNIRTAERKTGGKCRVFMDLAGPKLRTERIVSHPQKRVNAGDHLVMAARDDDSTRFSGVAFTCTCREVFASLKVGSEVWIDDGALGCKVEEIHPMGALLRVFHAPTDGKRIKPDKGVNFPGLVLPISSLTDKDRKDLDFVAGNADVIGFSFVQSAGDVSDLQEEIARRLKSGATAPPIVAKIETHKAVLNLPEIMVQGAGHGKFGVMIARGDLAVEIGYLRLAEIQEEILWLAEAADVPVIWATQVLEKMTREGIHSRAEMTDAVMGERAECVMLNKGAHLVDAVATLSRILENHESNQQKKIQRLRALKSW